MVSNKPVLLKNLFNVYEDHRGFLGTTNLDEIKKKTSGFDYAYKLSSFSKYKNTFRGLHYQTSPHEQDKMLFVISGKIKDFCVNLENLSVVKDFEAEAGDVIFIPSNYAHGFLTISDDVFLEYFMNKTFKSTHYKGLNFKVLKSFGFPDDLIISEKDLNLPTKLI